MYNIIYDDNCQLYHAKKTPITDTIWGSLDSPVVNEWLILEYKLETDWTNSDYHTISWWNEEVAPTYLADAEICIDKKDFSVMGFEMDESGVTDISKYAYAKDENQTTLKEITSSEIPAVAQKLANGKVYAWELAENISEKGEGGTVKYDANTAGITFGTARYMKKDMYLYFDIYVSAPCTLTMFSGSNANAYLYIYANSTVAKENGASYTHEYALYDESGKAYDTGSIWGGSFNGKWITVEFKLFGDWGMKDGVKDIITRYTYSDNYKQAYYLANIKLSTTKILGTTAE